MGPCHFDIIPENIARLVHRNDDFAARVPLFQVPNRLGNLAQCVAPVDDWGNLSRLHPIAQGIEIFGIQFCQYKN